jgi:hypothetical protein
MDKAKRTIREGETSQWIREKRKSEKERHDVSASLIFFFPLSIVMSLLL